MITRLSAYGGGGESGTGVGWLGGEAISLFMSGGSETSIDVWVSVATTGSGTLNSETISTLIQYVKLFHNDSLFIILVQFITI